MSGAEGLVYLLLGGIGGAVFTLAMLFHGGTWVIRSLARAAKQASEQPRAEAPLAGPRPNTTTSGPVLVTYTREHGFRAGDAES